VTTFAFLASAVRLGTARGPRLAVVWHMAEGGGTAGYLSRPNPNGVSVHFVVEYSGRTVQMLSLGEMHTSIRPSAIRDTTDANGLYGATAARAVMGDWADTRKSLGPNHASIGVEVEGFAKDGPNAKQKDAIAALWRQLSFTYDNIRSLGHRDFNGYKACPGQLFPWDLVGGHGTNVDEPLEESDMPDLQLTVEDDSAERGDGFLRFPILATPAYFMNGAKTTIFAGAVMRAHFRARSALLNGSGYVVGNPGQPLRFVGLSKAPAFVAYPDPDRYDDGVADERARIKALIG